jgi:predicted regulator of Ras-like GTPase activity (Roadblock/LC7/MglB family)
MVKKETGNHNWWEEDSLEYTLGQKQLEDIEGILQKDFMELGVHCVVLIDMAGNIIVNLDNGAMTHDVYSLAALAAGNFGAVSAMAKIVGEKEFSLLFHKGEKENIHFSKVMDDFLLITIFGMETSLGFLRLKVAEATKKIKKILEN